MCILRANIGTNTFTAEEPGPQKANPSTLAHEINSALCIFPPKNVKKASLDILKAQSPAISSLHTHGASSAAHRDMIPATQKTGFCQGEGPSSVYGETCCPPGYQPHTFPLFLCRGSELRSFRYLLAAANHEQLAPEEGSDQYTIQSIGFFSLILFHLGVWEEVWACWLKLYILDQ